MAASLWREATHRRRHLRLRNPALYVGLAKADRREAQADGARRREQQRDQRVQSLHHGEERGARPRR